MMLKRAACGWLLAGSAWIGLAQVPRTPPAASVRPVAPDSLPSIVSGIAVNYDEAKVGAYTLPNALILNDGKPVRDRKTWTEKRRPEIVSLFETQQYGRAPGRPAAESFEMFEKGTLALSGKAIRRQVDIALTTDKAGPVIHLLEYLPAAVKRRVPMLLSINFGAVSHAVEDPGVRVNDVWDAKTHQRVPPGKGNGFGRIDVEALLAAGFGVSTFYYGDVDPDDPQGFADGIRAKYGSAGRGPEDWGAIAAWAWGMSRVMDYLETDPAVDAKRVAIHGISRLGKTVMWAGAHDQRFAAVIASCSGEGGAALSRRDYGETVAHLTDPARFLYQFAPNYAKYANNIAAMPMDANLLVALVAPRPLLLQTGDTDFWSDPKGEFLAEVAAEPVYRLLGKDGLDTQVWPEAKVPILHDEAYFMHDGGHGMVASDWSVYVTFLTMHLHPER